MKKHLIIILAVLCMIAGASDSFAQKKFRIGMIGLDTSHVVAFTKYINDPAKNLDFTIVAAFKGGSADIESSANRIDGFTAQLVDDFGVKLYDSVEELCKNVDGIMLESVDGRPHFAQAKPVIDAGLPLFIDKPMAASLEDVVAIFDLAKKKNVPCWSSSSLRFSPGIIGMRNNEDIGNVLGVDAYSPCSLNEHHPDLYWYGVHGVEILFTIMGPGCESVRRVQADDYEHVVGVWKDGRIGTFRGLRKGKHDYGATVYGSKGIAPSGGYGGYGPLVDEVLKFFTTGVVPVPAEETIEVFAFMTAADVSKAKNGQAVKIQDVIRDAKK